AARRYHLSNPPAGHPARKRGWQGLRLGGPHARKGSAPAHRVRLAGSGRYLEFLPILEFQDSLSRVERAAGSRYGAADYPCRKFSGKAGGTGRGTPAPGTDAAMSAFSGTGHEI